MRGLAPDHSIDMLPRYSVSSGEAAFSTYSPPSGSEDRSALTPVRVFKVFIFKSCLLLLPSMQQIKHKFIVL